MTDPRHVPSYLQERISLRKGQRRPVPQSESARERPAGPALVAQNPAEAGGAEGHTAACGISTDAQSHGPESPECHVQSLKCQRFVPTATCTRGSSEGRRPPMNARRMPPRKEARGRGTLEPRASRRPHVGGGDAGLTGCRAAESLPHTVPARPPNPGALPCRPGEGGCGPVPRRALNSDPRSLSRVAEEGHLTQEDSAALAERTAGTARRPAQEGKRPPGRNAGAAGRVRGE